MPLARSEFSVTSKVGRVLGLTNTHKSRGKSFLCKSQWPEQEKGNAYARVSYLHPMDPVLYLIRNSILEGAWITYFELRPSFSQAIRNIIINDSIAIVVPFHFFPKQWYTYRYVVKYSIVQGTRQSPSHSWPTPSNELLGQKRVLCNAVNYNIIYGSFACIGKINDKRSARTKS